MNWTGRLILWNYSLKLPHMWFEHKFHQQRWFFFIFFFTGITVFEQKWMQSQAPGNCLWKEDSNQLNCVLLKGRSKVRMMLMDMIFLLTCSSSSTLQKRGGSTTSSSVVTFFFLLVRAFLSLMLFRRGLSFTGNSSSLRGPMLVG